MSQDPRKTIRKTATGYLTFDGKAATEAEYQAQFGKAEKKKEVRPTINSSGEASILVSGVPYGPKLYAAGYNSILDVPRNSADLEKIKGIGPKAAATILDYLDDDM